MGSRNGIGTTAKGGMVGASLKDPILKKNSITRESLGTILLGYKSSVQ